MSQYLPESTKTGDFNSQKALSESFFVIPERLASIRSVVLVFTANKQTNKQTNKPFGAASASIIHYSLFIIRVHHVPQHTRA